VALRIRWLILGLDQRPSHFWAQRPNHFSAAVRPLRLPTARRCATLGGDMSQHERKHDAAAVELAAGWIAICATCGWVGDTYGSREKAAADSARHVAEAPAEPALAFLADARRPTGARPGADAA
jgi:hypothetical protein